MNGTPDSTLLELSFAAAHREGQLRWGEVHLTLELFVSACRDAGVREEAVALRADDLYLAYAAGLGEPHASEALDKQILSSLDPHLRRVGVGADAVSDVLQAIRERLMTGARPRLLTYDGSVPLRSWIKIIAVRLAIDHVRTSSFAARSERLYATEPADVRPDVATLLAKAQYKAKFERALREELARLPDDHRAVLRQYLVENQSLDTVARRLGVHRVTVNRWLWRAGEQILDNLRRRFQVELGVFAPDFDSLVRLMRSTMSVDLGTLV